MDKKLKICAGASAGGHANQLLRLLEHSDAWVAQPSFYVTTMPELKSAFEDKAPTYVIGECNRMNPFRVLLVLFRAFNILIKERPDLIITTGSMPIAMLCVLSKLFGTKIIWIDSIANTKSLSMSGSFMRFFADLFLTQWPEVSERYNGVEYVGELI
jgi:beta-1,4-N-acetylglucosaminyltransferase